jgi:hypothetical protein
LGGTNPLREGKDMATKTIEQKNIPTAAEVLAAKKNLEDMTETLKVNALTASRGPVASVTALCGTLIGS